MLRYRARHASRLVGSRKRDLAYLGWVGQGNVGDEAILQGQLLIHDSDKVAVLPVHDVRGTTALIRRLRPDVLPADLLMGGGTVIGRPEWLDRARGYLDVVPGSQLSVWGAGVEDPRFRGSRSHSSVSSVTAWASYLKGSRVGVRGPRSVEILCESGIDAEVVGDPALMLRPRGVDGMKCPRGVEDPIVAVNVASVEDRYANDSWKSASWFAELFRLLDKMGCAIAPFAMDARDGVAIDEAVAASGVPTRELVFFDDPQRAVDWLAQADAVVSERLHGNILSACGYTPFISLDYRPKCLDFAESIGRGSSNVIPSDTTPSECAEMVAKLLVNRVDETEMIAAAVDILRTKLRGYGRPGVASSQ